MFNYFKKTHGRPTARYLSILIKFYNSKKKKYENLLKRCQHHQLDNMYMYRLKFVLEIIKFLSIKNFKLKKNQLFNNFELF